MRGHTELISSLAKTIGSAGFWLAVAAAGLASASASAAGTNQTDAEPGVLWVYVGTYTSGGGADKSQGIYLLDLDLRSGKLGPPRLAGEATDPSFLAVHPSKPLSLCRERARRGRWQTGRRGARVFDRSGNRRTERDQPAILAGRGSVPPGRGPIGKERPRRELRQWQRGLSADGRGRQACSRIGVHSARGQGN